MKINSTEYLAMLEAARAATSTTQTTTTQSVSTTSSSQSLLDEYIPSDSEDEILYANYNNILSTMTPPPMPPVPPTDTESTTDTEESDVTSSISNAVQSIIDSLSESLRANEDTVLSTLESLGLTPEDLLDSDNVELVANALNEGAEKLGLPTVDDLDQIIADLKSSIEETVSGLESEYSLSEEDLEDLIEQLKARILEHLGESDEDITTLLNSTQIAVEE
ncbi:hypothetical protein [Konateibacter massiliensis]|uniref:hypothetical protein n=1 Tax=Konateibacter massiliensis TaxID=2002841 RepID=UPI000C14C7AA|nr:hypothetical protein [Konateibacter massiliensis]